MRVLFIAFDSEELSIRLTSALAKHLEVCLKLPEEGSKPHLRWISKRVRFEPFAKPRLRQPVRQIRRVLQLVQSIRRYQPDVIHFQKGHLWFNLALPLLKKFPLVISIHDPVAHVGDHESRKTPQWIRNFGFRRADQVIVHSPPMKQLTAEKCDIPLARIHVIPLLERGDPDAAQDIAEEEGTVLFFGRIWKYKGLEYLIRAEPLVSAEIPDAKFVIAGTGEDFERYQKMIVNRDRFVIHNRFVPHDEIPVLFRQSSVVVLPYIGATQSGVIPTAYTYAKPVVATTVGGLPSMVEHGRTGLLVEPKNERELAAAIVRLLKNRELRRELGDNGKRKADNEFSAEATAKLTSDVYELAVRNGRREESRK